MYHYNDLLINDIVGRLAITSLPSFENTKLLKKIRLAIGILDLKNFTLFKKIRFDDLQPGTYLVKIYKEHPLFGQQRKYIGYSIVDLKKNSSTHIFCRPEGHVKIVAHDQQNTPVHDVDLRLLSDNITIAETSTTSEEVTVLSAPCYGRKTYELQALYKGFLVSEKPLPLPYSASIFPRTISLEVPLYNLVVNLTDLWGFPPQEQLTPLLTDSDMKEPTILTAQSLGKGQYLFENLYPATYQLQVFYHSSRLQKNITVPSSDANGITLVIPTKYQVTLVTYDARGMQLPKTTVILEREGKTLNLNESDDGRFTTQVPPGTYSVTVYDTTAMIEKRMLIIISDRSFDLVTTEEPLFPLIVIAVSIGSFLVAAFMVLRKRNLRQCLKIGAMTLMVISLVVPWWMIQGTSTEPAITTVTHLYFLPSALISFTTTPSVLAGERASASVPTLFTLFMTLLLSVIIISAIFIVLHMLAQRSQRKKLLRAFLIIGIIFLMLSLIGFYGGMSLITKVGVGGVFGQGTITVTIPGETTHIPVPSSWGLDSGFYLCVVALFLLIGSSLPSRKKNKNNLIKRLPYFPS